MAAHELTIMLYLNIPPIINKLNIVLMRMILIILREKNIKSNIPLNILICF